MTNDGKLALLGDSIVVDVKTHKEIAVLKDEYGRRIVHTEKALYPELPGREADRGEQPVCHRRCQGVRGADGLQDE